MSWEGERLEIYIIDKMNLAWKISIIYSLNIKKIRIIFVI